MKNNEQRLQDLPKQPVWVRKYSEDSKMQNTLHIFNPKPLISPLKNQMVGQNVDDYCGRQKGF